MHVLIVVDMQNDFIDGALGTAEAVAIVPNVVKKIRDFDGIVLATKDTHGEDYLSTQEGKNLPVVHCVKGTEGWELNPSVAELIDEPAIEKPTFGSVRLGEVLAALSRKAPVLLHCDLRACLHAFDLSRRFKSARGAERKRSR